jgi:hypothetical protein
MWLDANLVGAYFADCDGNACFVGIQRFVYEDSVAERPDVLPSAKSTVVAFLRFGGASDVFQGSSHDVSPLKVVPRRGDRGVGGLDALGAVFVQALLRILLAVEIERFAADVALAVEFRKASVEIGEGELTVLENPVVVDSHGAVSSHVKLV